MEEQQPREEDESEESVELMLAAAESDSDQEQQGAIAIAPGAAKYARPEAGGNRVSDMLERLPPVPRAAPELPEYPPVCSGVLSDAHALLSRSILTWSHCNLVRGPTQGLTLRIGSTMGSMKGLGQSTAGDKFTRDWLITERARLEYMALCLFLLLNSSRIGMRCMEWEGLDGMRGVPPDIPGDPSHLIRGEDQEITVENVIVTEEIGTGTEKESLDGEMTIVDEEETLSILGTESTEGESCLHFENREESFLRNVDVAYLLHTLLSFLLFL
jgi:hypothetical protein